MRQLEDGAAGTAVAIEGRTVQISCRVEDHWGDGLVSIIALAAMKGVQDLFGPLAIAGGLQAKDVARAIAGIRRAIQISGRVEDQTGPRICPVRRIEGVQDCFGPGSIGAGCQFKDRAAADMAPRLNMAAKDGRAVQISFLVDNQSSVRADPILAVILEAVEDGFGPGSMGGRGSVQRRCRNRRRYHIPRNSRRKTWCRTSFLSRRRSRQRKG